MWREKMNEKLMGSKLRARCTEKRFLPLKRRTEIPCREKNEITESERKESKRRGRLGKVKNYK